MLAINYENSKSNMEDKRYKRRRKIQIGDIKIKQPQELSEQCNKTTNNETEI